MNKVSMLLEPVRVFLEQVGAFLPRLALALVVLIAGWLLAKIARFAVVRTLRAINFNVLTDRAGMDGFLAQGGIESDTTDIFGLLVYWLVILFVPKVIAALLILAFGAYFARFIGNTVAAYCRNVGIQDATLLAKLAQYAIVTFVVLIALQQVDIGGEIVRASFLILLGGLVFALALAFGLGGQKWAAGRIARWWPDGDTEDRK